MIRLPSRVSQSAVYSQLSPEFDYLDTSASVAEAGMRTIADVDISAWAMSDRVPVLAVKDADNAALYLAMWSPSDDGFVIFETEWTLGTLSYGDAVTCSVVASGLGMTRLATDLRVRYAGGTTTAITGDDAGFLLRCGGGAGCTVTLPDDLPAGTQVTVVAESTGAVTLSCGGTATINGGTADVSLPGQYGSALCYVGDFAGQWHVLLRSQPL